MSWRASLPGMCLLGMTGRFPEDLPGGSCGILTNSRFRLETLDDSLQPTIDMLLNVTIFMWYVSYSRVWRILADSARYGAVCPWTSFVHNDVVPIYRLVGVGILVLLLRRLPFLLAIHKMIPQIENINQAVFVGFFGPVGVSAVFYLLVAVEFVETLHVDGEPREDVKHLAETITVVVWFLVICSVVCVTLFPS